MTYTTATETELEAIHRLLTEAHQRLATIDWPRECIDSVELGTHMTALDAHIDAAIGRSSTVFMTARKLL